MARTMPSGFVVDEAILMIEKSCEPRKRGDAMQAALEGAGEIGYDRLDIDIAVRGIIAVSDERHRRTVVTASSHARRCCDSTVSVVVSLDI